MSAYESNRQVPLGAISIFRAVGAIESGIQAIRNWRRARATEAALSELSDVQLRDIGLHRGAIPELAGQLARR